MARNRPSPRVNPLFSQAFQKRIRVLREGAGFSQGDIAKRLRISVDAYKKYETRPKSMLPHHLVQPFLDAVGAGSDGYYFLFTGRILETTNHRAKENNVRNHQ